jgi:hypothetical protein
MKTIRVVLALLIFALSGLLSPALATSSTTDQSDLWWNPSESGWGIQFVQRGSTIFATMFVYDQTRTPFWYSATLAQQGTSFTWTGDLIATTGPWFGTVPFNPATVTVARVGTMTWSAQFVNSGVLTYTAAGISVSKNLVRQTIANENYAGHYGGGLHQDVTGCTNHSFNGTFETIGILNINQSGTSVSLQSLPTGGGSCSFSGALTQQGQMGTVDGSYSCTSGDIGAFHLFEMQVNITGVTGRFSATSTSVAGCQSTGWFGGLRVTTF